MNKEPRARVAFTLNLLKPTPPPSTPDQVIYYWLVQGGVSVFICSYCQCLSAFCLSLTFCSFYLGYPGHLLGKSCPLGIPLELFLLYAIFILVFHSHLLSGAGCGIRLCRFSRDMTKPTKWLCTQRRLRSAWASAQSDQSLCCPHEESLAS